MIESVFKLDRELDMKGFHASHHQQHHECEANGKLAYFLSCASLEI